jgi:hypothetical protein
MFKDIEKTIGLAKNPQLGLPPVHKQKNLNYRLVGESVVLS